MKVMTQKPENFTPKTSSGRGRTESPYTVEARKLVLAAYKDQKTRWVGEEESKNKEGKTVKTAAQMTERLLQTLRRVAGDEGLKINVLEKADNDEMFSFEVIKKD